MAEKKTPRPYSVSSLTSELKSALEARFTRIYVEAEISGWRLYPSGHAYFTLKDVDAQISAVMFAGSLARCRAKDGLKDGAKVLVYGSVSVYAPRGNYQFVVLAAKLVGDGDLMQRYLELKERLGAEGLFDPARKRHLPFMPRRIGIVTSEAGAVIHDMCTVLTRRFPALEIRLFPCLVQGEAAAATIVAGIRYFNAIGGDRAQPPAIGEWRADLLIVARGGGSFEDLFCFNDETLVRAVAASAIPTISAVGHETDFTLCDFAADVRAGTPSIAAEIAVPMLSDLASRLRTSRSQLVAAMRGRGEFFAQRVDQLSDALRAALSISQANAERRLERLPPRMASALVRAQADAAQRLERQHARLASALTLAHAVAERRLERLRPRLTASLQLAHSSAKTRLDRLAPRLEPAVRLRVQREQARLATAEAKLVAYSPYGVLERGYSLTTAADGSVVRDAATLGKGDVLSTRFARGAVTSVVE